MKQIFMINYKCSYLKICHLITIMLKLLEFIIKLIFPSNAKIYFLILTNFIDLNLYFYSLNQMKTKNSSRGKHKYANITINQTETLTSPAISIPEESPNG